MQALGDLWYSARSLARQPGLTLALLLTIALGVGSNASVYGFVRGLVTPDLPIPHIDRVVSVFTRDARGALAPVSLESFLALAAGADVFESLGAARESRVPITVDGRTTTVTVADVTPDLSDLLQVSPADGVVVSDRLHRSDFGGSTKEDRPIRIDGVDRDVQGVAPEWLEGLYAGRAVDVWMPLREDGIQGLDRRSLTFSVIGRLREGLSAREAEAALNAGSPGAREPGSPVVAITVVPYTGLTPEAATGMSRLATLLPAAAAAVFLIACVNVAAFLLARASARSHETSVRVALGVTRGRLARQLLSDSALISIAGGALGVLLAFWTSRIVPAFLYDVHAEHLVFAPDLTSLIGAAVACGAITIACGLLPLFETRHDDPAAVLQRTTSGPSNAMLRVRRGLVAVQMACCCVLLISTGLLFEGFHTALRTRAGERLGEPILATVRAEHGFGRPDLGLEYFRTVEKAAREVPGITTTAWVATPPGGLTSWYDVRIEPPNLPVRRVELDVVSFTPQSLDTVVMPPVAGRMFGGGDRPGGCKVVILNQAAADVLFGGDAVGRAIEGPARDLLEIIGVVAARPVGGAAIRPTVYYYAEQTGTPLSPSTFVVPELPRATVGGVLDANVVSAGYFGALGLSTTAGTLFRDEPEPSRCRTGVVNQEASEQYFAGNAVGGAVLDRTGRRTTIVGVVQSATLRASDRRVDPSIYFPMTQDFVPRMTLMLGAKESDDVLVRAVQQQLEPIAGGSVIPDGVVTLETHLSRTALAPERIAIVLVGAAAAIALALGAVGIYGAMAEFVRQRRREFALRIALGAQRRRVIGQILMTGTRLAAAGIVAGMAGALLVARWLARITPDVASSPSPVWIAGPLVLLAAVALASLIPARRAMMVNPLTIMRDN